MNCLNPQTIYNKYLHRYVTVPCCKCETCLVQKQNILASRCSNECKKHKCNLFFTLTYTNNYVPLLSPHSNIVHLRRRNLHLLSRRMINGVIHKDYEFLDDYEVISPAKYKDIYIDNLFAKDLSKDIDGVAHSKYTGVLSKRDINLFLNVCVMKSVKRNLKTKNLGIYLLANMVENVIDRTTTVLSTRITKCSENGFVKIFFKFGECVILMRCRKKLL